MNTKIIKLDINGRLYERITAKQRDTKSRYLFFNLLDGAVPFNLIGKSVRVYAIKPDRTEIFNDLQIVDASKGICKLELTTQILAVSGIVLIELMIMEGESKLTSIPFELEVIKSLNSTSAIESSNEYKALDRSLTKVEEWNNEFADKSGKLEELYTERLNGLDSHLADMAYYVTPEMFTGISDADKINNALNSPSNTVILKGDYNINKTIIVPSGKTLDLGTSKLKLTSNVDMIHLNNGSKLLSGFISLESNIEALFDKSVIKLLSTNGISTFQTIKDIQIVNSVKTGSAITFDVSTSGSYIAYANLDNFRIRGFDLGVDVTVPNIPPHVAGSGYDNWITTCKIHGFISRANQGLRLDDESNNGSSIQGMDIFLRGQAGDKNANYDEAIYAKCCQSTFNVILDDAGDTTTVSNYIVFDRLSSKNNYIGANEKVVDNGLENIILNSTHYGATSTIMNVKGSGAKALGYINNILYNADERFTVTTNLTNCTLSPAMNVFKALGYTTSIVKTDATLEAIAKYNIVFPSAKSIPTFAVQLTQNYAKCKLRFRYNTTWVESKEFNSSLIVVNIYDLFKTHANVNEVEIIFTLPIDYKNTVGIQAITGYGEDSTRGNLLPRDGGEVFGNIEFTKSWYGTVLKSPNGTKYRIKVADDGTLSTQTV